MNAPPTPGLYRHYKGNLYTVLGIALHSETGEELVVYRPEYGERRLWVRPRAMFLETVSIEGALVPRFTQIQDPPQSAGHATPDMPDRPGPRA